MYDNSVIEKQRVQLEELQERKEQIEMMFQWQKSLMDLEDQVIDQLSEFWSELVPGFSLNESGKKGLNKLKKRFSLEEHGNEIAEGLGLSDLMSQWGVGDEKIVQYWPSVEKRKNKHFVRSGLPRRFEIGHLINPERQIIELPVAFRKWNELSPFDWGKFCSYVAIGLGALAGGPIGVAGIIAGSAYLAGEDDDDD